MARTFDGSDDVIEVTASSSLESPSTALTAAILFRPSSTVESFGGLLYKTNDSANSWAILIDSSTVMNFYAELQSGTGVTAQVNEALMTVDTYYWLVLRWSSGSVVSLRVYNMDGTTNQTVQSAGTVTHTLTYGGTNRQLRFCQNEATANLGGDVAAAGVWASSLSDADVTTMMGSPAGMASLNPVASWLFDQASIATPVPDETGGGADQSAITGTTVATFPVPGGYGTPGSISHDAISENSTTDATSFTADTNWTHTPVGTPAAVIACITQPLASTDGVVGCTYGGVTMDRLISQARTVTEQMRVYIYGLFAAIPTGAQTFAIDVSDASAKHGMIFTATVAGDGWTIAQDSENSADLGIIANPSITVTHTGTLSGWAGYAAHGYGAATPVSTGLQTGETYQAGHDPGAATAMVYTRHGGADAASSTYGYTTLASDDQVIAAVVLKGVAPAAAAAPPPPTVVNQAVPRSYYY